VVLNIGKPSERLLEAIVVPALAGLLCVLAGAGLVFAILGGAL
jgi:membrane-bound ClpP family serine protease